jgi:dipeptidyl aminopeptidase/acylaminoacyl peptidase
MIPIRTRRGWAAHVLVALAAAAPAVAQHQPPPAIPVEAQVATGADPAFDLSVANIMRGELLVGRSPSEVRWSEDSRWVYFRWREPNATDTTTHVYRVSARGGSPERLPDSLAWRTAPTGQGDWSVDGRRRAVSRNGDIYVIDTSGRERRITDTPVREGGAHLSPDGSTVYFLANNNVFAVAVDGGPVRQLTDIRLADGPRDAEKEGIARVLQEQQRELFGVIDERVREREHREAMDSVRTTVRPTYLGARNRLGSAEISPSGRYVLISTSNEVEDRGTIVANFVTETGYTEELNGRNKVGDVQAGQRTGILDLGNGGVTWLEPVPADRSLTVTAVGWAPRSDRALIMVIPADYKDRWIYTATPAGNLAQVDHIRDDAWVGGPGLFTAGWLPDGERVYFVSERTGWAHLYTAPADGGEATPITSGAWEVRDVSLSRDGRTFHLTTSETHPGEQHLYTVPVGGGSRTPIISLDGWNEATVSPDGRRVAILHSTANRPPELYVQPLSRSAEARRVTVSTSDEFLRGPWIEPAIVTIPARDGAQVYARIYRPEDVGAQRNGAAVIFVHGAGYLQNVHRGWSSYFREYMFHHLLASRGYVVLDMDYRGSAGYGRDWRTGIYRHMGGKDLSDHVDGARWLAANEGVSPERVGIYGGSYGGFITLMALFTEPDVFEAGAALRSVTDWAHYNHWYTSRILNQPQDDPEAYRRSSPIYFAEGLEGHLLIAHGMVDTNVHFQDDVRLAQRLIELGKENWEMAVYPVENHGFVRPESWTDEYRRILELFERTIGGR